MRVCRESNPDRPIHSPARYLYATAAGWNSTRLDRKQDFNVLYQVCAFRADRKNKMAALVFDWLRHFRLLLWNRWTEFNETWQEARSQRRPPSLCFFGPIEKNKMSALASDWLRHFRLLLRDRWTEFNETWQEARSHRRLSSLCFSGRSEKQNGRPVLLLAETFSTSLLNLWMEFNETWQEVKSQRPLPNMKNC